MDITPRTRSRTRLRREPTPKLSERKKKLFSEEKSPVTRRNIFTRSSRVIAEEDDDSDIGPMSPLQFSSSPSNFNHLHNISETGNSTRNGRKDFSNILKDISTKKEQPKRKIKWTSSPVDESGSTERRRKGEDDVVEPLCTSMQNLSSTSMPPKSQETISDGNNLDYQEPNYEQQMKTPHDLSKSSTQHNGRGISSKKSLIFDTGMTPDPMDSTASSSKLNESDVLDRSKAKASLSFGESTISTESFYGKPSETVIAVSQPKVEVKLNDQVQLALAKKLEEKRKKKRMHARKMAQRKKGPTLWGSMGKMKSNKFKRPVFKKANSSKSSTKQNTSVSSSHDTSAQQISDADIPNSVFTSNIEHNLRLQQILKDQTNALSHSRAINWAGDGSQNASAAGFSDSEYESDDEQTENQNPQLENIIVEQEDQTKRKFFKSNPSSSVKYRVMGRLNATVKRGGDLKLQMPKRKKRRANKEEVPSVLNDEISDILNRLSSPSKTKPSNIEIIEDVYVHVSNIADNIDVQELTGTETESIDVIQSNDDLPNEAAIQYDYETEKYRQMIPYKTTDPAKIDQQYSILDLLVVNGICNDETFKIFIAEPELHKDRANEILDSLYCLEPAEFDDAETNETIQSPEWIDEINAAPVVHATTDESQVVLLPNTDEGLLPSSADAEAMLVSPNLSPHSSYVESSSPLASPIPQQDPNENALDAQSTPKVFPIFQKNFAPAQTKSSPFITVAKSTKEWRPIGNQQLQIDAGQKNFGLRQCNKCDMEYSVHEPEDELLHLKFHNCVDTLSFKGWTNERVVTEIMEWSIDGRIIFICENDNKAKKDRIKEILEMVDRNLGFAARAELKPKTLVYLAIAKQQIIGVCVTHPIEKAHRLATNDGIDCYSTETYPAKCGISRIWVAPNYRRRGIAAKLITAIRSHFIFACFLSFDEIAFSAPTDDGKRLAASLAQRSDFLIYES